MELDFRAWDGNRYVYLRDYKARPGHHEILSSFFLDSAGCVIEQAIGILDDTGEKIYCGDIVREAHSLNGNEQEAEIGIIKNEAGGPKIDFGNRGAYPTATRQPHSMEFAFSHTLVETTWLVIGNINENPDMIKVLDVS